jgi:hypothetical protein
MDKQLIRKIGEETIYSAKGHFKAGDLRRNLFTIVIWSCAILNLTGLIGMNPTADKIMSALGLLGTIALLIWNEGEGKEYKAKHKQAAEGYLSLHKDARLLYFSDDVSDKKIKELSRKVSELDKSSRPDIPIIAKEWAKRAIEKSGETDIWWID